MEKIDFVVTWVDGSDPKWRESKHFYENGGKAAGGGSHVQARAAGESNSDCRYRDYGTLRYWFRAVEKFTPWVNRVFFVTCGQKPDWLNENHPKLRLVNHTDYIPAEYLPTFHSNTIELNLHRIPDLSEHFVLFNDDVFVLRPVSPEAFFRKGLPVLSCDLAIPNWLGCSNTSRLALNNGGMLKRSFNVERAVWRNSHKFFSIPKLGFVRAMKNLISFSVNRIWIPGTFGHLKMPHLKSTFEEIWRAQPMIMDRSSRAKFRIDDGINHWMVCGWNMLKGNFVPDNEKRHGEYVSPDDGNVAQVCKLIRSQAIPQICLNDSERITDPEGCFRQIAEAFESILPEKSGFEK